MASNEDMDMVVALFERGYSETQIKEALQNCSTLAEAMAWLAGRATEIPGAQAICPNSVGHQGAGSSSGHRRRKSIETKALKPPTPRTWPLLNVNTLDNTSVISLSSAMPLHNTSCAITKPDTSKHKKSTGVGLITTGRSSFEDSSVQLGVPIEPRDASAWWQEAATRWLTVTRPQTTPIEAMPAATQQPACSDGCLGADLTPSRRRALKDDEARKFAPGTPQMTKSKEIEAQVLSSPSPLVTLSSSPRSMQLNDKSEVCELCCDDVPPWRAVRLTCSHGWYCAQCMLKHAEARLAMGAASITCPECRTTLHDRDINKMLPPEIIDRLLARSLDQAVSTVADLWSCPTPNCPMRVALEDGELPQLQCPLCKKHSCLRCGAQPYHKNLTCEEHSEQLRGKAKKQRKDMDSLMQWMEKTGTKQCPTCHMAVTKQNLENQQTQYSECHKMICRNCNTRFCFKCLAVLTNKYTCGCSIDLHGFINPHTGKRVSHFNQDRGRPVAKRRACGEKYKRCPRDV